MRFTTVELDGLSASITAALYPEVRLAVRGFQDFTVRPAYSDQTRHRFQSQTGHL